MDYYFGVDIGGTTVKIGLLNEKERLVDKWEIKTIKIHSKIGIVTLQFLRCL